MESNRSARTSHIWHPYTRFSAAQAGLPCICKAEGIYLFDGTGRRYVDAVSSWWACALGHSHPRVVDAIQAQANTLQHSILGNLTHPGAQELAEHLVELMPTPDRHVLFASDGSSAVEAALKIALQFAHQTGRTSRTKFVSLNEAYHGDTLGAVGVGYLDSFHHLLQPALKEAWRLDIPACNGCMDVQCEAPCFKGVPAFLTEHAEEVAAVIVEPLCLGAAGMKMYGAGWLRQLANTCNDLQIPLIVDEIAMGFGRTGRMFAFENAGINPDMICVGKALTAGYLPMSATIVRDHLYDTFSDEPNDHTFYHGHTWSGNPIAAAAALATLDVIKEDDIVARAANAGNRLAAMLQPLHDVEQIRDVRYLGMIHAVEFRPDSGTPTRARKVQAGMHKRGYLLRPLGDVIYLMPPLIISDQELQELAQALIETIEEICHQD